MLSKISFAVLVLVILFITIKRSKPTEILQSDRGNLPATGPAPNEETTVDDIEQIVIISPPAVQLPAASSANTCDEGDDFWATGSWGRIGNVSSSCWVYPNPYSFAIECDAGGLSSRGMTFLLEIHAHLVVKELACTNCKHLPKPLHAGLVTFLAKAASPPKAASDRTRAEGSVASTPLSTYTVKVKPSACLKGSGTYNHSCIVMIDARVSLAPSVDKLPEVCFLSIGDWGTANPDMLAVAAMMSNLARKTLLKFIFSTGDNFYPTGVMTLQDPHWQETFELPFASLYLQNIRWYICAGNHDQWGLPSQLEYGIDHPRWYFPSRTYSDSIPLYRNAKCTTDEKIDLFVLNSAGKSADKQVDDMTTFFSVKKQQLAANAKKGSAARNWRFVINHEPMYSGGMHGQAKRNDGLRTRYLEPIFDSKIHAYFGGDDHFLEVHRATGTDFFVSGGGAGGRRYPTVRIPETVWALSEVTGIMLHCVQGGTMRTSLIDEKGKVHYAHNTHFSSIWQENEQLKTIKREKKK